jgi:hypothetical protein
MSDAGEDWTELETFVRVLIDTGNASLESKVKIPDREPLQWAIDKLSRFCAAFEAIEQSHANYPHKAVIRRSLVRSALAAAYEIGQHGTISANTKRAAAEAKAEEMREAGGKQLQDDPDRETTMRIISEVVECHRVRRHGDAHPYKMARAILPNVNQALEAKGLDPVNRDRIARYIIKTRPARS